MPKKDIDYSNTSFYRIVCKDLNITDCYVGHTTNLVQRRSKHKYDCINSSSPNYNSYVYKFIRENGGWINWDLIEIERKNCIDYEDARQKERHFYETFNSTLNSSNPSRTDAQYREDTKIERKNWFISNKEKIFKKNECKCGGSYQRYHKVNHLKTKKHIAYIKNNQTTEENI